MSEKEKKHSIEDIEIEKKTDAAEIKEILSTVTTQLPQLIKSLFSSLYSPEIATEYGKSIGALYKQLKEQGLPEDMVKEIVMNYVKSINLLSNAISTKDSGIRAEKRITRKEKVHGEI